MAENQEAPRKPLNVYDMLPIFIEQMSSVAWQKLGLQHDPVTGGMDMDLSQARVAIDLVAQLAGHLEPQLDDEDKRQLQSLVRDLRINFVQRSGA